jgi:DNA-binding PadR family transcriptional regulator
MHETRLSQRNMGCLLVGGLASQYAVTMVPAHEPALTLSEWIVLSLICEGRTHGNAVTQQLARSGEVGRIWSVPRAMVYRSISRLTDLGLIRSAGEEPTSQGPVRQLVEATDEGRVMAAAWQHRPAQHTRDIRSELLVKLALLDRSGVDPHDLLTAQRILRRRVRPHPDAVAVRDRHRHPPFPGRAGDGTAVAPAQIPQPAGQLPQIDTGATRPPDLN